MPNALINFRCPPGERAALIALSRRTGLPQSALVRAGVRAVVSNPQLILDAPAPAANELVGTKRVENATAPAPPPRRRRRGKR